MFTNKLLGFVPLLIPAFMLEAGEVELVSGSTARFSIVLAHDATAPERFAAEELARWTKALTGAEPSLSPEPQKGLIPLSFSRLDARDDASGVRYDGFRVEASDSRVVISGKHPASPVFAAYYLLNRFGGVDWFEPDSGADFVATDRFAIPAGTLVKVPLMKRQGVPAGNGPWSTSARREAVALWNARNGFLLNEYEPGKDPAAVQLGNSYCNETIRRCGHFSEGASDASVGDLILRSDVDPKELAEELAKVKANDRAKFKTGRTMWWYAKWKILCRNHPEWFALVDGKRVPCGVELREGVDYIGGPTAMPCLSNPSTRAKLLECVQTWREKTCPGKPFHAKVICDDQLRWCECESCMKLLRKKGKTPGADKASDYWWDYANWFTGELLKDPQACAKIYVYSTYQDFPKRVKPVIRDRMSIRVCPHGRCYIHSLADTTCPMNGRFRKMIEDWIALGAPVVTFEYMCELPGASNYGFWEKSWVKDLKWYAEKGVSPAAGGLFGPWDGYRGLEGYNWANEARSRWQIACLTGHFEWDPQDDFGAVRDRMLKKYYRAAAQPMTAYRQLLEKAFYGTDMCMSDDRTYQIFEKAAATPGVISQARKLLREAVRLAGDDIELVRRIARDRELFYTNWERASLPPDTEIVGLADRLDRAITEQDWMMTVPVALSPSVRARAIYDAGNVHLRVERADGTVDLSHHSLSELGKREGDHVTFPVRGEPSAVFILGTGGNLIANASFEELGKPPHGTLDGANWTFRSAEAPTGWFFQQDGGIAEAKCGAAGEGERYLHVESRVAGAPVHILRNIGMSPPDAQAYRVSFLARGKCRGNVTFLSKGGAAVSEDFFVNTTEWKRFVRIVSVGGKRLTRVMFNFTGAVDWDDVSLTAEDAEKGEIALVSDGQPKVSVVLASDATISEKFAAEELVAWTKAVTGVGLKVGVSPVAGLIPVSFRRLERGESASGVKYDGFRLDASEKEFVISAQDPQGIVFGVYYLLNRYGGIDWFHPASGADFVPADRFAVPAGVMVKTPMASRRGVDTGNGEGTTPEMRRQCGLWNARNGFPLVEERPGADPKNVELGNYFDNETIRQAGWTPYGIGGPGVGSMLLETEVDAAELKAEIERVRREERATFKTGRTIPLYAKWKVLCRHHPEWFALVDGKRVPCGVELREGVDYIGGHAAMPCLSNPSTRAAMLASIRRWRDSYCPGAPYIYKLLCDDQPQWCECDDCMKLMKSKGSADVTDKASDYWWDFVNAMTAEMVKDPLAACAVYAYRNYQAVPERVKPILRDRVYIRLCPHGRCYAHSYVDPQCTKNPKFRKMFEAWVSLGFPVATFEYMCQLPGKCNYAFWEKAWVKDLKWYAENGISHTAGGLVGPWNGYRSIDTYFWHNAAKARWHISYLTGHFEWDPQDDFDTVRDRMLCKYYRAAAKTMTKYHRLLEKAFYDTGMCMDYGADGGVFACMAALPGVMDEARALLAEAETIAKADPELARRLAMDREYFHTNLESSEISPRSGPVADVVRVSGQPTASAWDAIAPIGTFRSLAGAGCDTPERSALPAALPASLKAAWDGDMLYLHFDCAKTNGVVKDFPPDGSRFEALTGTHVEFFLMSPKLKGWYYHCGVSHGGLSYSALTASGRQQDFTKKLDFKYAIADEADKWTLDVAVPLSGLGGVRADDCWKVDACVCGRKADGSSAGYDSLCGWGVHLTEYWQVLRFANLKDK